MPLLKIQFSTENPIYLNRKMKVLRLLGQRGVNGEILDFGCGYGSYSLVFAQTHGNMIKAVDQDSGRIQILEQAGKSLGISERIRLAVCQLEEWDTTAKFDLVMVNYVMYLIDKSAHEKLLRQINRFLKKDGLLLLVEATPLPPRTFQPIKNWFSALRWDWCGRDIPQFRSPSDWVELANRSGLDLQETQFEDGWWTCLVSRMGEGIRARVAAIWYGITKVTRPSPFSTSEQGITTVSAASHPILCTKKYNVLFGFMRATNFMNRLFPHWATQIHIFRRAD